MILLRGMKDIRNLQDFMMESSSMYCVKKGLGVNMRSSDCYITMLTKFGKSPVVCPELAPNTTFVNHGQ